MAPGNWGRWGTADERGSLNWITPELVVRAAGLVQQGRVYTLAVPLDRKTPAPPHRLPLAHFMDRDGGDYAAGARRPGGFQFSEDTVLMATHSGAHMDALAHAWCDDQLYNGFPGQSVRSTTGAQHCSIERVGAVVGRGVLLDAARHLGTDPLPAGFELTPAALAGCAAAAGISIGRGDVVLIRTGWLNTAATLGEAYFQGEPGPGLAAARWLTEQEVAAVGADNYAFEVLPSPSGSHFPVHLHLLRDHGTAIMEGLQLEALAQGGVAEFLFVAAPLPIVGGVGSPLTPVAIV